MRCWARSSTRYLDDKDDRARRHHRRNSILLVDFINLQTASGMPFAEAVVRLAIIRAQPIALTALAAMLGALFILDDPIFNGLAVSLVLGIMVSRLLTLVVIPLLYYVIY